MSKAIMLSIRPKWCEKIISGEKTVEVRKNRPKLETPFKCYIYCTKAEERLLTILKDGDENYGETYHGKPVFIKTETVSACDMWGKRQKVIGEFVCRGFIPFCKARPCFVMEAPEEIERMACMTRKEIWKYAPEGNPIGWRISDLLIYDTPRELGEFERPYECDECNAKWATECNACHEEGKIKRPPQSWCYVEEDDNG